MQVPEREEHPAATESHQVRLDYLSIVATLAFSDGNEEQREADVLTSLAQALQLNDGDVAQCLEFAKQGQDAAIAKAESFRSTGLAVQLLSDAIAVIFADREVATTESHEIARLAQALDIQLAQAQLLARSVEGRLSVDPGSLSSTLGHALVDEQAPRTGFLSWLFGRRRGPT